MHEDLDDFLFWEGEAEGAHRDAQFVVVEVAVAVHVEEIELVVVSQC